LIRTAGSARLARRARASELVGRVVHRYVAGENLDEGLAAARRIAASGAELTLDHVGEFVASIDQAKAAAEVYRTLLEHIGRDGLPAGISVKPTQLGLMLDHETCATLVEDLASHAHDAGVHLTLDMEDHPVVEDTIRLVERAQAAGHHNVGCAVQAYLHRTTEDVRRLIAAGASLRLCKGAYAEPEHVAYQRRVDVDRAYLEAARYLLAHGTMPRFATHDHRLVAAIKRSAAQLGRDRSTYEFQMLYGIREEMQRSLVADGYGLRIYVPFGTEWFSYFTRRLAERPANLVFFLRALRPTGTTGTKDTSTPTA
jgi:proline dehydrogenase